MNNSHAQELMSKARIGDLVTIRNDGGALQSGRVVRVSPIVCRDARGHRWTVGVSSIVRITPC